MSWLFGMGSGPKVPELPPPEAPSADGNAESGGGPKGSSRMAYSFDSQALERAAKAAKDLEKSPNAKEALALSKAQEETRQLEMQAQMKQMDLQIENSKSQQRRVAEEERRKSMAEEASHAKKKMDYQDQLARKRQADELAAARATNDENLAKQEESVKRQEAMRRATIEHELEKKHKLDMERVAAETTARAKAERENRDVHLEQIKARGAESRKTTIESISAIGTILGKGAQDFISDPSKITSAVAGLTFLAVGVYSAKRGTSVLSRVVESRLAKPSLVRSTSRLTATDLFGHPIRTIRQFFHKPKDPLEGVVLMPELERRLRDVALMTANTRRNGGLYRNIMFYGPPGTGKTMFAKSLSLHSGMDYAIMTGGDVAPMGRDGVSAIHKLFDWAQTSRNGLLVFVDEADAFLRKRSTENISEDMRATLNAFLYRTGEQSDKFMLCIASNQPEQFDWAVNDRFDELVHFERPGLHERNRLLLEYFQRYIAEPALAASGLFKSKSRLKLADMDWTAKCAEVAKQTGGLSGREMAKLVTSWQAAAYASETGELSEELIDAKVAEAMRSHAIKANWLEEERKVIKKKKSELDEAVRTIDAKTTAADK